LNEAKSKIPAGVPKNTSVVYTEEGDKYKCVVDAVDAAGNPLHNEWTDAFDGKDYPLVGDPNADTRSVKMEKANHYGLANKTAGSRDDGNNRALSRRQDAYPGHALDGRRRQESATFVFDKQ
jgi:hypothetical protein